jgi:hypothetical protein
MMSLHKQKISQAFNHSQPRLPRAAADNTVFSRV